MIKIMKKVSVVFRGSSAVFRFMEHLHFRPRGAGDDRFTGFLPCLALPWISGTGGASFLGFVWVQSGLAIPCFAIKSPQG